MSIDLQSFLTSGFIFEDYASETLWIGWGPVIRSSKPQTLGYSLYAPDFFLQDPHPWWHFAHVQKTSKKEISSFLKEHLSVTLPILWQPLDFQDFEKDFHSLKKEFQNHQLKKAVPLVFQTGEGPINLISWIFNLCQSTQNLPLKLYGIWNQEEGLLGATPELLFQTQGVSFLTMALAGTQQENTSALLLKDPKEWQEHLWVVQGIQESLSPWAHIQQGTTQILSIPPLAHLITPLSFQWNASTEPCFEDLISLLHPTPALGAFPKKPGLDWLKNVSSTSKKRHRFGAPFGIHYAETSQNPIWCCLVAIRNLQWNQSNLFLGAGCGIIEQSQLLLEMKEIQHKMDAVKHCFRLATSYPT